MADQSQADLLSALGTKKLKRTDVEAGTWTHVYAPTKGMMTAKPPTLLDKEASPYIKGCYCKEGEVVSDSGYIPFPTAGALKTNLLHGKILKYDQLYTVNGNSYLLCFTTTNTYLYNTTTDTWDNITVGTLANDCEDAWTAIDGNVTCSASSTVKLRGTYSAKNAVAAAFTTGIAATRVVTSADLTACTALHFWIRSSIALAAGQVKVGISETATLGGTPLYFDVPVLVANTWTPCCVDGDFTGYNAVISVGLNVVTDVGAAGADIYLDDIKGVDALTGDEDNRYSVTVMNDTMIFTNGVDLIRTYNGTGNTTILGTADGLDLNTGHLTTCEVVVSFKDHLICFNNTENGADCPQRASWSNIGSTTDFINGTAGYLDLTDDESWIMGAGQIGENLVSIYKERSIVGMDWVGGHTPFRFTTKLVGTGLVGKEAFENMGGEHFVFGPDVVYKYMGGGDLDTIDDSVHKFLFGRMNDTNLHKVMVKFIEEDDELQIWMPTVDTDPDEVWCYDVVLKVWYIRDKAMTGFGYYKKQSATTIAQLVGNIGEQNWRFGDLITRANSPITLVGDESGYAYQLDKTTLNNNGVLIHNEFQTPDFVLPETDDYMNKFMRVPQLIFEAKGQSVDTYWSDDGGSSWNTTSIPGGNTTTLTSSYELYQQDFDTTVRKIRFKFVNDVVSSGFFLRYYGIYWLARSGRR
jgi:hypothetical protein